MTTKRNYNEQFTFIKKLRTAAQNYLTDDATGEIVLLPRSEEIEVVYYDLDDRAKNGEPKKKRTNLQSLIGKIEEKRNISINAVSTKHIDMRSFALDSIKAADLVLDKFAKVQGLYQKKDEKKKVHHWQSIVLISIVRRILCPVQNEDKRLNAEAWRISRQRKHYR